MAQWSAHLHLMRDVEDTNLFEDIFIPTSVCSPKIKFSPDSESADYYWIPDLIGYKR